MLPELSDSHVGAILEEEFHASGVERLSCRGNPYGCPENLKTGRGTMHRAPAKNIVNQIGKKVVYISVSIWYRIKTAFSKSLNF